MFAMQHPMRTIVALISSVTLLGCGSKAAAPQEPAEVASTEPAAMTPPEADGERVDAAELARMQVRKLVFEGFPMWVARPVNADKCPTVAELVEFGGDAEDPWGNAILVRCTDLPPGAFAIAVWSLGPDGQDGTTDDVRSWE
jgi:hypothetical protein